MEVINYIVHKGQHIGQTVFSTPLLASHGLMGQLETALLQVVSFTQGMEALRPTMVQFLNLASHIIGAYSALISYLSRMFHSQAPSFCFPENPYLPMKNS